MNLEKCAPTLAICLALLGCAASPREITPTPSTRNFLALSCEQLAAESKRIGEGYDNLRYGHGQRWKASRDSRHTMAILGGEVAGVNDAIRINSCKIPSVQIPGDPWRQKRP